MRKMLAVAFGIAALSSGAALAQEEVAAAPVEKPTPEAILSFWQYYFKGQGNGPVLADAKLCLEISKEGDTKNECAKEVPAEGVKAGTPIYVWQAYLLPQGEVVEDMALQVKLGDTVRETKDIKLKGESIRTRQWTYVKPAKAGTWKLVLLRGDQEVKTLTVQAN
jgi:hypothetical protein